jgi:transposase
MDMREAKALEIAARMRLTFDGRAWTVPSQTGSGTYKVVLGPGAPTCTCDDFQLRQQPCKHIIAARLVRERDGEVKAPAIDTDVIPKRPTYKQDWQAYNLAQTQEKNRFQVLLFDLCQGVEEPERTGAGRRPTSLADAVFAAAFKVYSTVSTRRFSCDLADAHQKGYVSKPVHYHSICAYLENPARTPVLRDLIARSAAPLKAIEKTFAVDSSGFSSSRFVRWFDEKYGTTRSGHDWVKVHIITGTLTNVVPAIEILHRDAADSPQFKPLVEVAAQTFTVGEVSADKAYSSLENVEVVEALGGFPAIAFKVNATGGIGGAFEKLFYFYSLHREEFLKLYHKRSNAESTFSMVKAKFGDSVRSRTDAAMKNEALCKFLCHNLCCVIQSQCALGIEAEFWPDENGGEEEEVAILPLKRNGMK